MKDIETEEDLEKLIEPKKIHIENFEVTKYGESSRRVMILTLGEKTEYTDKIARLISLITVPKGYQVIRIDGENIKDRIKKLYQNISDESITFYSFSYKNLVSEVIETFRELGGDKIKRFYFVSPDFQNENAYKNLGWIEEAEILISSEDKEVIGKRCKKLANLYKMHLSVEVGKKNFEDIKDLLAIQVWLSGTRNAKYSNNNLLVFLAVGVFGGYILQGILEDKISFLNTKFPVGMFVGMVIAVIIEELWRRRK